MIACYKRTSMLNQLFDFMDQHKSAYRIILTKEEWTALNKEERTYNQKRPREFVRNNKIVEVCSVDWVESESLNSKR